MYYHALMESVKKIIEENTKEVVWGDDRHIIVPIERAKNYRIYDEIPKIRVTFQSGYYREFFPHQIELNKEKRVLIACDEEIQFDYIVKTTFFTVLWEEVFPEPEDEEEF